MVPEKVQKVLSAHGLEALEFEPGSTPTAEMAARRLGVIPARIAKSLLFKTKAGAYVLVVCPGDKRIPSGVLRQVIGAKVSMTNAEETERVTGFRPGGVCPFGLEGHRAAHAQLRDQVDGLVDRFNADSGLPPAELLGFMEDWLSEHVRTQDRPMVTFVLAAQEQVS